MENKKLQEISAKVIEILAEREKEITGVAEKIKEAKRMQNAANEAVTETFSKADVKGYHEAQDAAREGKDAVEMYQRRMEQLEKEPLMSKEEYSNMVQQIIVELSSVVSKDKKKIISLIDQIRAIRDRENEIIEAGNELINTLQHKCFKDDACIETAKGKRIHLGSLEKEFKDYSVARFVSQLENGYFYKENRGE